MSGVDLIRVERTRQIREEGHGRPDDRRHTREQLALAAATYALPAEWRDMTVLGTPLRQTFWPQGWWFKPTSDDRVRELIKAGALIAAEIDRLEAEPPREVTSG